MVFISELSPPPHPLAACDRLRSLPGLLFFDSARGGRHSYLMADPWELVRDPAVLRERIRANARPPLPDLPPFQGGAAGWIDYEWMGDAGESEAFRFGMYDWAIAWDHEAGRAWLVSTGLPAEGSARIERARERAARILGLLDGAELPLPAPPGKTDFRSDFSSAAYGEAVREVLRRIEAREVEQLNLSHRLSAPFEEDPWSLYLRLREGNPAPFALFAQSEGRVLASASPERFFDVRGGRVEARPIKGTRPRGVDDAEDRRLGEELLGSEKERRENRLVAGLLMDELSSVCREVELVDFCLLEKHPTVQHLVSIIRAELPEGRDPLDLLLALFPPTSIAGRPKGRSMEIIEELEGRERRAYCGSAAWWSLGGDFDANVLIRTFVIEGDVVHFSVGGGIVAGSCPEQEWEETMHKARALLLAAGADI